VEKYFYIKQHLFNPKDITTMVDLKDHENVSNVMHCVKFNNKNNQLDYCYKFFKTGADISNIKSEIKKENNFNKIMIVEKSISYDSPMLYAIIESYCNRAIDIIE